MQIRGLIMFCAAACVAASAAAQPLVLRNATVVSTDTGRFARHRTVIIDHGRIIAVQPRKHTAPTGARVIDLKGSFIVPGLIDSHVHLPMASLGKLMGESAAPSLIDQQTAMAPYIASGVTTLAVMSGGPDLLPLRNAISAGSIIGPSMLIASPMIAGASPIIPPPVTFSITDSASAARAVRDFRSRGYDLLKLREDLTPTQARALIEEGRRAGLPVVGHIPRTLTDFRDLLKGRFGFAHLYDLLAAKPYYADNPTALARLLKDQGAWVITTLGVHTNNIAKNRDYKATLTAPGAQYVHPQLYKMWTSNSFEPNAADDLLHRQVAQQRPLVRALVQAGVPVIAGSDAGNPTIVPGSSLHDELDQLSASGLSPFDILRSATVVPARVWNIPAGRIAAGQRADILVLDANPLADINNLRSPRAVIVDGKWLDRSEIGAMLNAATKLHQRSN